MATRIYLLPGGARLIIETDARDAVAILQVRQKQATDLMPFLEAVAGILREAFGRDFAEGGRPSWKALAASTIAAKMGANLPGRTAKGRVPWRLKQRGAFGAANILIASGRLRDSYRLKGSQDHIEIYDVANGTVTVGSRVPYAAVQQKGGRDPYEIRAKFARALAFTGGSGAAILRRAVKHPPLPARPVGVQAEDKRAIALAFRTHMAGKRLQQRAA